MVKVSRTFPKATAGGVVLQLQDGGAEIMNKMTNHLVSGKEKRQAWEVSL